MLRMAGVGSGGAPARPAAAPASEFAKPAGATRASPALLSIEEYLESIAPGLGACAAAFKVRRRRL
jgi:hypothetical protein